MKKEIIDMHLSVFLFGFAGLFGKLISAPPTIIVLGRVAFASLFLYIVALYSKENLRIERGERKFMPILGFLLALHWSAFFYSIQLSTVAIGLLTYSTCPVFTIILESLFLKEKLKPVNFLLAFITFFGVYLIVPHFELSDKVTQGVIWGILSGLTFSFLTIINGKYAKRYSSLTLALYQDSFAIIFLLPLLLISKFEISLTDLLYLFLLGTIFTGIAHALFIRSLREIQAHKANIIANLEPVYGILLSFLLLHEIPSLRTVMGGTIILIVSFYVTWSSAKFK